MPNTKLFDAHFHIIDHRFPIVANQGFLPEEFTSNDYLHQMNEHSLCGGAIVSGSFQAFDQTYLKEALTQLGSSYVGVTQLPKSVSNDELLKLNEVGVRAIRFNLQRGGSEKLQELDSMARRIYEIAQWHVELYIESNRLADIYQTLIKLPAVSIDHLGLSKDGFSTVVKLAEHGVRVKACGFGRVNFDVKTALNEIYTANPHSLMFGTDLPSTRAPRPYHDNDITLINDNFAPDQAKNIFYKNALAFYTKSDSS